MSRKFRGAKQNKFTAEPGCPTCHVSATLTPLVVPARPLIPAAWIWSAPAVAAALASRDLAVILRTYRRLNGFSQQHLADLLGYDKTYVSMIETGRRSINDLGTRRHIARTLALPTHVLGITDDMKAQHRPPRNGTPSSESRLGGFTSRPANAKAPTTLSGQP